MEVDAGRTADESVKSQVKLNIVLYVAVFAAVAVIGVLGSMMWDAHAAKGGDRSGNALVQFGKFVIDKRVPGGTRAGDDTGRGRIAAVRAADESEQETWNDVLDTATAVTEAFLNLDYQDLETTKTAVLAGATGDFAEQYEASFDDLSTLTVRAQAVQTGDVIWAGISSVDPDSAVVMIAANTTVDNKLTDAPVAYPYRLKLELVLVDDEWKVSDLSFIDEDQPTEQPSGEPAEQPSDQPTEEESP